MGLSNFVNKLLSHDRNSHRTNPAPQPHPTASARPSKSPPVSNHPPRRRRPQPQRPPPYKEDWEADYESAWAFDDDLEAAPYNGSPHYESTTYEYEPPPSDSRRFRRNTRRNRRLPEENGPSSSNAFTASRRSLKFRRDPSVDSDWRDDLANRPSLQFKQAFNDRNDRDDRSSRDGPSSRRRVAWPKFHHPRVKSNMEQSVHMQEPPTPTRFRNHRFHVYPPPFAAEAYADPATDSSPSLKRFLAGHRTSATKNRASLSNRPMKNDLYSPSEMRQPVSLGRRDGPRSLDSRDTTLFHKDDHRDGPPSRGLRSRRAGRIMSNIDQFIRREPSVDRRASASRRNSLVNDADLSSQSQSQAHSLSNSNSISQTFFQSHSHTTSQSRSQSTEPISLVNTAVFAPHPAPSEKPHPAPRKPEPSLQPKPPPSPHPKGNTKAKELRQKLQLTDDSDLSERFTMQRRFADADITASHQRFSADAAFPTRPRETLSPAFARSQSNPAPPTQPRRRQKKRPPPLLTPIDGAPGFAFGVGADAAGIRRIALRRESSPVNRDRKSFERASMSAVTEDSDTTELSPSAEATKAKPFPAPEVDDGIPEPKAYAKSNIWNTNQSRPTEPLSGPRFSKRPSEREQDLFYFEEASQSSFGDTDSPSRIAAKNGIVPIDHRLRSGEIMEDNFVFGDDDSSFNDGGFIICSKGVVSAPEKVTRKTSDGIAVEGVPTSSNNLIFVKSLDEFRKRYTFKNNNRKDGGSTLGRGAAGRVYLAVHEPTGRKIAVKEINVYDQDKRNQLKKELVTLISHQSRFLVRSFGAFYDGNGGVHVALEYMDRGALSDIITQQGRIPERVVCKIAEHCLRGLFFLHANHILHRDVKTGNILLSRKLCRAKLSDFGLVRDLKEGRERGEAKSGDGSSVTHTFVGTIAYMSPERLKGDNYTYASDVWGLGIAVMECVMGRHPFDKPQSFFDVIDSAISTPATLIEGTVSDDLADFVRLCTHVDPEKRPKAVELLEHPWIRSGRDDAYALRGWLDSLPRLRCQDVEVGSDLAGPANSERQIDSKAKIRAKAEESRL